MSQQTMQENLGMYFDLVLESLESRLNLDGNLSVVLTSAGDLRVTGDNLDNTFDIVSIDQDTLLVDPRGQTTVNGGDPGAALRVNFDTLRDLRVTLRGGNDIAFISLDSQSFRNGTVNMGTGNDFVRFQDIGFTGNLRVSLANGVAGEAPYQSGKDQVLIVASNVDVGRNLQLSSGSTNDLVEVNGAPGVNRNVVEGALRLSTGSGNDVSLIEDTIVRGTVLVNLAAGDDVFSWQRTMLMSRATFNGGPGNDSYADLGGNLSDIEPALRGFELA